MLVKQDITPSSHAKCLSIDSSETGNIMIHPRKNQRDEDPDSAKIEPEQSAINPEELTKPIRDTAEYIGKFLNSISLSFTKVI